MDTKKTGVKRGHVLPEKMPSPSICLAMKQLVNDLDLLGNLFCDLLFLLFLLSHAEML